MQPHLSHKAKPFYLNGPNGKLFAIYHAPQDNSGSRECFLYVQPLGEEMDRCRQMVAMQAREFSKLGYGCLLLDLYGTGDSEGDYQDGHWDAYLDDLRAGLQWLAAEGYDSVRLWAIRHGALLALDLARTLTTPSKLLFWQPVLNGKTAITQILRIALAGSLSDENKISMSALRKRIQENAIIELSGYETAGSLLATYETKHASDFYHTPNLEIQWFEVLASTEQNRTKESIQIEQHWKDAGAPLHCETVIGPAFWQVWERVVVDSLIARTKIWAQQLR